jgi:hypothetical protein
MDLTGTDLKTSACSSRVWPEPDHQRIVEPTRTGNALEAAEVVYWHGYSARIECGCLEKEKTQASQHVTVSS